MNLAVLLSGRGGTPRRRRCCARSSRPIPSNADAAYSLGLLLVELGQTDEALALAGDAPARHRRRTRASRYNLGLLLQQLGRLDEAEAALRAALELRRPTWTSSTPWPTTTSSRGRCPRRWRWPSA